MFIHTAWKRAMFFWHQRGGDFHSTAGNSSGWNHGAYVQHMARKKKQNIMVNVYKLKNLK